MSHQLLAARDFMHSFSQEFVKLTPHPSIFKASPEGHLTSPRILSPAEQTLT
jgi:hypothetical protein